MRCSAVVSSSYLVQESTSVKHTTAGDQIIGNTTAQFEPLKGKVKVLVKVRPVTDRLCVVTVLITVILLIWSKSEPGFGCPWLTGRSGKRQKVRGSDCFVRLIDQAQVLWAFTS